MATSGPAIFFDGVTSARHGVTVELGTNTLLVRAHDGRALAEWPFDEIEELSAPEGLLRVGRRGSAALARLEVTDPELAVAIDEHPAPLDPSGTGGRPGRAQVIFWG